MFFWKYIIIGQCAKQISTEKERKRRGMIKWLIYELHKKIFEMIKYDIQKQTETRMKKN